MATWNTPRQDWALNDIVTADDMNDIGENLAYLKDREARNRDNLSPVNIDTNVWTTLGSVNITTRGGDVLAGFYASVYHTSGGRGYFDIAVDGTRYALSGSNGSLEIAPSGYSEMGTTSMQLLLTGIAAGAHTVTLQWKTTASHLHVTYGQFYAIEV